LIPKKWRENLLQKINVAPPFFMSFFKQERMNSIVTPLPQHRVNWPIVANLTVHHIGAILALFSFSWTAFALTFFLHWIIGSLGITLGYHRLLTHRSFKTPKWLEYTIATLGCLSGQGGPIEWVGIHRIHHKYSDTIEDPHNSDRGFWWSHMGWLLQAPPADAQEQISQVTSDLNDDPYYQFLGKYYLAPNLLLAAILYCCGGWSFVAWGICARMILTYNTTWFVNSAAHKWGYQNFESGDRSTNCWWVALIAYGEGWHNNHHAYPHSARHGMKWWEFDATWIVIQILRFFGLASNVRLPKSK
jgi:sn-1 stearoyl-lipid 9-desaturase